MEGTNVPDKFSKEVRSKIMSSIRSKNTQPEIVIRKLIWSKGKRYRIHDRTVYGTPDISNRRKKLAVFIDGCFWHGCKKCCTVPQTNTSFWKKKISNNRKRREKVASKLKFDGWKMMEFWEHEVKEYPSQVAYKISRLL